ncbi:hypothetical protein [Streptomyces griseoluteus]|uniref:hypothetical protein n=1 Tax=Streptomyces griseoluteus TaxID=29306 RepID=UPI00370104AF
MSRARDGPVNQGHACVKGRFAHGYLDSRERLTRPPLRRDGRLEPGGWDKALGHVAQCLSAAVAADGTDAVAAISSARATGSGDGEVADDRCCGRSPTRGANS